MGDFIVTPQSLGCPNPSPNLGASVTSAVTYDGAVLPCIGFNPDTTLNANLASLNEIMCSVRNQQTKILEKYINNLNEQIKDISQNIANLDCKDIDTGGIAWACINPANDSLCSALEAIEAKLCTIETGSGQQQLCADDGAGSGGSTYLYRKYEADSYVHEKTAKFDISSYGTGTFTHEGGGTTDQNGCTEETAGGTKSVTDAPGGYTDSWFWIKNKKGEGVIYEKTAIAAAEPTVQEDETRLYRLATDGAGVMSLSLDQREYAPLSEKSFRSTTNLDNFISSVDSSKLNLDSKLTYVNLETFTDDKDVVNKKYVDDSVAAAGAGLWTDNGFPNGIYYIGQVVGIGTSSPDFAVSLHVSGSLKFETGNEQAGRYWVDQGSGIGDWVDAPLMQVEVQDEGIVQAADITSFNFVGGGISAVAAGGVATITVAGAVAGFDDLSDVNVASASTDELLRYNGTVWTSSSNIKSDGTQFAIGNPTSINAALHVRDAVGNNIAKFEGTGGVAGIIDTSGVLTYNELITYTYTNLAANPLNTGYVLTDLDGTGKAVWTDPSTLAASGLQAVTDAGNFTTNDIILRDATVPSLIWDDTVFTCTLRPVPITGSNKTIELPNHSMTMVGATSPLVTHNYLTRATDDHIIALSSVGDDGNNTWLGGSVDANSRLKVESAEQSTIKVINTVTSGKAYAVNVQYDQSNASNVYGHLISVKNSGAGNAYAIGIDNGNTYFNNGSMMLGQSDVTDASAILEMQSTTKGFLLPRMDSTQRNNIVSPATGLQVYDTIDNEIYYYSGSAWESLSAAGIDWSPITTNYIPYKDSATTIADSPMQYNAATNRMGVFGSTVGGTAFKVYANDGNSRIAVSASAVYTVSDSTVIAGVEATATGSRTNGTNAAFYASANGNSNRNAGFYGLLTTSSAGDNIGLYVNVSNAGAGNAYIGTFIDGNEGAGKVLTSDANGNASWQTASGGLSGTGTTNRLAKWTGASTLGTSNVEDTGLEVKITSPVFRTNNIAIGTGLGTNQIYSPTYGNITIVEDVTTAGTTVEITNGNLRVAETATFPYSLSDQYIDIDAVNGRIEFNDGAGNLSQLIFPSGNYGFTLPNQTGTIALLSDIPSLGAYLPLAGGTMTGDIDLNGNSISDGGFDLNFSLTGVRVADAFSQQMTITPTGLVEYVASLGFRGTIDMSAITNNRIWQMPNNGGTVALTSDLSAYLSLGGGVMSGIINMGTNSTIYSDSGFSNTFNTTTLTANRSVDLPNKSGVLGIDVEIATKATNAIVQAPTATEDGYAITWDNTAGEYTLSSVGGGGVTGSGTVNKIPKWGTTTSLTDSNITDLGSTVVVAADLNIDNNDFYLGNGIGAGTMVMYTTSQNFFYSIANSWFQLGDSGTTECRIKTNVQELQFRDSVGSTYNLRFSNIPTATRVWDLPDADGTLVVQDANNRLGLTGQIYSVMASTVTQSANAATIDWDNGNSQHLDLQGATGSVVLTLSNPQAGASYMLKIQQSTTSPQDVTFPASVLWADGLAPTISTGADAIDTIVLFYDGTNYYANFAQNYS